MSAKSNKPDLRKLAHEVCDVSVLLDQVDVILNTGIEKLPNQKELGRVAREAASESQHFLYAAQRLLELAVKKANQNYLDIDCAARS